MLYSTIFLNSLFFSIIRTKFIINTTARYPYYDISYNESLRNFNSIRRIRSMPRSAVCSELHKVEDSPFIVMILIRESGRFICMGTIIDEYHVLTAKTCFYTKNYQVDIPSLMVVAGYASPHFGRHSQVKFVNRIAQHPKVNLAILLLSKPFTMKSTVRQIRVIGPETALKGFKSSFQHFRPYLVEGIVLPSKIWPKRGDLIPKGWTYEFKPENKLLGVQDGSPGTCEDHCTRSVRTCPALDETYNICTPGDAEFCWTALGSPMIVFIEQRVVQIAIVTFADCRFLATTAEPTAQWPNIENSPYIYIRLDSFSKWIKANSFIDEKERVKT